MLRFLYVISNAKVSCHMRSRANFFLGEIFYRLIYHCLVLKDLFLNLFYFLGNIYFLFIYLIIHLLHINHVAQRSYIAYFSIVILKFEVILLTLK